MSAHTTLNWHRNENMRLFQINLKCCDVIGSPDSVCDRCRSLKCWARYSKWERGEAIYLIVLEGAKGHLQNSPLNLETAWVKFFTYGSSLANGGNTRYPCVFNFAFHCYLKMRCIKVTNDVVTISQHLQQGN